MLMLACWTVYEPCKRYLHRYSCLRILLGLSFEKLLATKKRFQLAFILNISSHVRWWRTVTWIWISTTFTRTIIICIRRQHQQALIFAVAALFAFKVKIKLTGLYPDQTIAIPWISSQSKRDLLRMLSIAYLKTALLLPMIYASAGYINLSNCCQPKDT